MRAERTALVAWRPSHTPRFTRGNQQQAALLLGIARQTLRMKMRDLGLAIAPRVEVEDGLA
jgi:DNA-binding NtrC family response regulator